MNRIVVEVDRSGYKGVTLEPTIGAEYPNDVMIIFIDKLSAAYLDDYKPLVFGKDNLPIEPLAVERTAVGVAGGAVEVKFEVQP